MRISGSVARGVALVGGLGVVDALIRAHPPSMPALSRQALVITSFAALEGVGLIALAEAWRRARRGERRHPLTGLANGPALSEYIDQAVARASRRGQHNLALMFCDLDGFKAVNDRFGHDAANALLKQIALRLQLSVRPGDLVAHPHGDEFVIVAENVMNEREARALRSRLEHAVAAPLVVGKHQLSVTISIGLKWVDVALPTGESLIAEADRRMYRRKRAKAGLGRGDT